MKRKSKRTSIIWTMPKEDFGKMIQSFYSIAGILRHLGFAETGATHRMIKARCIEENIDFSHIKLGIGSNKGRKFVSRTKLPLESVMTENSTYNRCHLKRRLIQDGIIANKCCECGLAPEWNGKKLVLVLDHINGVSNDHRKENLRLLCPNCNSQQSTFAGRNKVD